MDRSGPPEVFCLGRNTGMRNLGLKYFLTELNCVVDTLIGMLLPRKFLVTLLVG